MVVGEGAKLRDRAKTERVSGERVRELRFKTHISLSGSTIMVGVLNCRLCPHHKTRRSPAQTATCTQPSDGLCGRTTTPALSYCPHPSLDSTRANASTQRARIFERHDATLARLVKEQLTCRDCDQWGCKCIRPRSVLVVTCRSSC